MLKIIKFSIIFLLIFNVFIIAISAVNAEDTTIIKGTDCNNYQCKAEDTTEQGKICCGNYSLNDMASVTTKIAALILSVVGSLALLAFVAGGLMWTVSAGNPDLVTRGKQTIIGAVIGLTIVFTSYMIIQLVFSSLGIEGNWATSNWFNK
ncbi:MAG: hypothetical protein Q8O93_02195 [bacterium]|nr:hypothetical protein [bacterium]